MSKSVKSSRPVQGREVPCLGEQHFSESSPLSHINDPTLRESIISCDDADEPYNSSSQLGTSTSSIVTPGGTKTRFLLSGLSADETKLSALIVCLLLTIAFSGYTYMTSGDISQNLTSIITTLIYAVAGINISNSVLNHWSQVNSSQPQRPPFDRP